MFQIRNKILVTFLSVVIIPIIIISVFFVFNTAESLKRDKIKDFKQTTETKVEKAEDFIRSVKNDIVSLSNSIFLLNLIDARKNKDIEQIYHCRFELNNLFKTLSESRSIYDQIRYIDEFGHEVVRVNLLYRDEVQIIPSEELQSKGHRYYFKEAVRLNEGEIYISELDLNKEHGEIETPHKPMLRYAIPVFDREKQNRGAIVLNVLADYLLNNILAYKSLNGINSYLLDKGGSYLLHPDISKQWGGKNDLNTGENMKNDFRQEISSLILAGHAGGELEDDYFLNFIPIHYDPLNGERYWLFMESIHKSIVYSSVYSFYLVFGILVLLLLSGGVTSTFLLSRKLTKPLKELVKGVTNIGKGNLDYQIAVTSKDEIALLSSSFNEMTSQLSESRKQLQDYALNLEHKVEVKTKEIKHMLDELKYKNDEMEQLVYVTSHDLRSPLLNIQGFSKELEKDIKKIHQKLNECITSIEAKEKLSDTLEVDIPDALRFILASTSKMDTLLSGLLRLSRIGRAVYSIELLDMNKLISNILRTCEYTIKEKKVTFRVEKLPPCRGDNDQIDQVFSNLIDNALKYLDSDRKGVVRISGRNENGHIIYCMEDNGLGIEERHMEKIFEIFYRHDPGNSIVGDGLGLPFVRKILGRHGGKIWVESEPGKGSKFFVSLPE